jgi:hypothetical protein
MSKMGVPQVSFALVAGAAMFAACSPDGIISNPPFFGEPASNGGSSGVGGSSAAGGTQEAAGTSSTGGASSATTGGTTTSASSSHSSGGASSGGSSATGGKLATGGISSTGGTTRTGGSASISSSAVGGTKVAGGTASTGGSKATGGTKAAGGTKATGGTKAAGGTKATGGATSTASTSTAAFNWGTNTYNPSGGSSISYQTHEVGTACLASCHSHRFTTGGTIYQANGTTAAANVEIGVIVNGTLYTTYSGSGGNFYLTISGTVDWSTAQVAIRTSTGTAVHPTTTGMSGNCGSANCHTSSNRIVVP